MSHWSKQNKIHLKHLKLPERKSNSPLFIIKWQYHERKPLFVYLLVLQFAITSFLFQFNLKSEKPPVLLNVKK